MSFPQSMFNILVVDGETQPAANCVEILQSEDFRCTLVNKKELSPNFIKQQPFDLLLYFLTDSQIDHFDRLKNIKAELTRRNVAVILLAEAFKPNFLQNIALVCDDFLLLPIEPAILTAKLQCLLNYRSNCQKQLENKNKLIEYQQYIEHDQTVANCLFDNVLSSCFLETSVIKSSFSSESLFQGNFLFVSRTPGDNLHLLLGDFSSHGALSIANPIADIFYSMTGKGFEIAEITTEINQKLCKFLPTDLFLATTLVTLSPDSKSLQLIACGLPEHFIVNRKNHNLTTISSNNIPLGIQSDYEFASQAYEVCSDDYLYLLTDGVFEAINTHGIQWDRQAIIESITQPGNSGFENLQANLNEYCQEVKDRAEMPYLELHCDVDTVPWQHKNEQQSHKIIPAQTWKMMMEFDIDTLRNLNPVPIIVNALMEVQSLQEHQQSIFMIITELFTNALDHGVLKLDASIKQTPEGFMRFYEQKTERLQTIDQGTLRLFIAHQPSATGGCLTIKVRDSGNGFDFLAQSPGLEGNEGFSGRGLDLLRSLCSRLSFQGNGNRVTAIFDWLR